MQEESVLLLLEEFIYLLLWNVVELEEYVASVSAVCLIDANITVFNPLDDQGREMFHPVSPFSAFFKNESWLQPYAVQPIKTVSELSEIPVPRK